MKVGILFTEAGGGHQAAANAIIRAWNNTYPEDEVSLIDIFHDMDAWPLTQLEEHWELSNRSRLAMSLNHFGFRLNSHPVFSSMVRKAFNKMYAGKFKQVLVEQKYDVLISTHFLATVLMESLQDTFTANIVTDLVTPPFLQATPFIDLHVCAHYQVYANLLKHGVNRNNIASPYFPNYMQQPEPLKLDLPNQPTILVTGGGLGATAMKDLFPNISNSENQKYNFILQVGKNKELEVHLQRQFQQYENIHVIGFVSNFTDYLNYADVIIAKPGPATICEIEALGKQAVFLSPIGPQEQGNIKFIQANPNFTFQPEYSSAIKTAIALADSSNIKFKPRFSTSSATEIVRLVRQRSVS